MKSCLTETTFSHATTPSGCPMFAPALPGFPTTQHQPRPRVRLSLKESRMKLLNATNLDRKSGIRGPKTTGRSPIKALSVLQPTGQRRVPHTPDFLCSFVGSLNFMRLSLKKGAHADLASSPGRKFGVSRSFLARCGKLTTLPLGASKFVH